MKKLFFVLALIAIAFVTMAQSTETATGVTKKFDVAKNATYYRYIGTANDTIGVIDSAWYQTFAINNRYDVLKQKLRVKIDEVTGTGKCTTYWKGKDFVSDNWTTISTIPYTGAGSDTTILIDQSSAKTYRFYQLYIDVNAKTAQTLKLLDLEISLYK